METIEIHQEIKKLNSDISALSQQKKVCLKIVKRINEKNYHDASILIRYYLNDNAFFWYKSIEAIIENQITNLFYDLTYNKNSCKEFFESQANKCEWEIKSREKRLLSLYEL